MSADTDVEAGFFNRFNTSQLSKQFPGKFWSGRIPDHDVAGKKQAMPYVHAKSEKEQDPQYAAFIGDGTDNYVDFRKVTLKVYAVGEKVTGDLTEQLKGLFDRKKFVVPNSFLMACLSKGEVSVEPDPTTKDGQDVHVGTIEFEVVSNRPVALAS